MRIVIAGAVLVLLAAGCQGSSGDGLPDRPPSTVSFGGTEAVLRVRLATTPEARRRGLMGVERLPADQGMAFVFDAPVRSTFWMKDTPVPLSIAFVDASDTIVTVRDMQPCAADPCPRYGATPPFVMAIEANQGWFAQHGIGVGDRADLQRAAYG